LFFSFQIIGSQSSTISPPLDTACELGFGGSLDEWERLMAAVARRRTIAARLSLLRETLAQCPDLQRPSSPNGEV
jgi:hypothetical protein